MFWNRVSHLYLNVKKLKPVLSLNKEIKKKIMLSAPCCNTKVVGLFEIINILLIELCDLHIFIYLFNVTFVH